MLMNEPPNTEDDDASLSFFIARQAETLKQMCDLKGWSDLSVTLAQFISQTKRLWSGNTEAGERRASPSEADSLQ